MSPSPRNRALKVITDYAITTAGALLVAIAAVLFLIPNRVVSGGVTGIATVLYYVLGTPVGMVTLILNIPLLLANIRWGGGWRAGALTVYAVLVMSLAIDLLPTHLLQTTADPVLYTVYGGLLDGLGIGLVLRAGGTTGGTDIVARLAHRFFGIPLGRSLLASNSLILGSAALVFGLEPAMYALLLAFVSSQVVDLVQEGMSPLRTVMVVSGHADDIRAAILERMERGVTILHGTGGYTDDPMEVVLCAIPLVELSRLKRLVHEVDPAAFVIVSPASEVLGEGFRHFQAP